MNSSKPTPLGKAANVISGFAFKSESFTDSGVPVIKIANIKNGQVVFDQGVKDFLPEAFLHTTSKKFHVVRGDVLISLTGSHITQPNSVVGRVARYSERFTSLLNQRAGKLVIRPEEKANLTFLYYLLSTRTAREEIALLAHGAANQANVAPKDIEKIKFYFPSENAQKKIAAVLSAYDDVIENNKRRIALLEKMAEEIYRDWFVRLRFPGHESVKVVKGWPEGWDKVPLEKAFTYTGGGTPSKDVDRFWKNGEVNWYTPSDITAAPGLFVNGSGERCTQEGLSSSSARLFPPYSIMMTSRATIGAIGINTTPACTNQGFITCIPNERYPLTFLYHWLKLSKPHFEILSGGATFAELTKGTFKRIEILTPPKKLVAKYEKIVLPMFKQIELRLKEIETLTKTRDMLLPRLISGKLSIKNLNIQFPLNMMDDTKNKGTRSASFKKTALSR